MLLLCSVSDNSECTEGAVPIANNALSASRSLSPERTARLTLFLD